MNAYLSIRLLPNASARSLFEAFAERFELEQLSDREATITWHPVLPEGATPRPPARTTLFVDPAEATWTVAARCITGPSTLARWSNLFRIGSIAMELVRRDIAGSWKLWTDIVALSDHPDDAYALALYPPREGEDVIRCGGASFHRFATVLGMEQFDQLRLDVRVDDHPFVTTHDWFELRRSFGYDD